MKFDVDVQTLADLDVFGKNKYRESLFSLFNLTHTSGGKSCLEDIFNYPTKDIRLLKSRQEIILFFQQHKIDTLEINERVEFIEHYLKQSRPERKQFRFITFWKSLFYWFNQNEIYYTKSYGVYYSSTFLKFLHDFIIGVDFMECPLELREKLERALDLMKSRPFEQMIQLQPAKKIKHTATEYFDFTIRHRDFKKFRALLDLFYEFDAYSAIAKAALKHGFSAPTYANSKKQELSFEGLFHPFLEKPVQNSLDLSAINHFCFLTGPNMAGKSTFLKAVGVAVFLAHIGVPVPAQNMQLTPFDGMVTSINLTDNLSGSVSHFYQEVLRVKSVAEKIIQGQSIVVIFDELFKGTNVKDAFDASLKVIQSFVKATNSTFIISTHIVEIGKEIDNVKVLFCHFGTEVINGAPAYTYKLKSGISGERLGMKILEQSGTLTLLDDIETENLD